MRNTCKQLPVSFFFKYKYKIRLNYESLLGLDWFYLFYLLFLKYMANLAELWETYDKINYLPSISFVYLYCF